MTKMYWYTKEFSKLTGVTVRTLYHYDKFKALTSKKIYLKDHLYEQAKFLEEKANSLMSASKILTNTLAEDSKSINWEQTLTLIEVYHMIEQLKNTWIGKALNNDELKQYAQFEKDLASRGEQQRLIFNKKWEDICQEIKDHLKDSPAGEVGIKIATKTHEALYELYGSKFAGLKCAIWEKGFQSGLNQSQDNHGLSMEMIEWLDIAMSTYWQNRNREILRKIGTISDEVILAEFTKSLTEMFGPQADLKEELLNKVLSLNEVPEKTKQWIKKNFDLLLS